MHGARNPHHWGKRQFFTTKHLAVRFYPTPVIGILGVVEDAANVVKLGFRNPGDVIILLDGLAESAQVHRRHIRRGCSPSPARIFFLGIFQDHRQHRGWPNLPPSTSPPKSAYNDV